MSPNLPLVVARIPPAPFALCCEVPSLEGKHYPSNNGTDTESSVITGLQSFFLAGLESNDGTAALHALGGSPLACHH